MLDASRQTVSTHLHREKKKSLYVNDWERSRKELLIAHSLCMMRAILCNWQCGLIVEALHSTINLLFLSCSFFSFSYLHLIAYFFLYLFACARTYAHVMYMSLNVIQYLDILMPNFFLWNFEKKLEKSLQQYTVKEHAVTTHVAEKYFYMKM